MYSWSQSGSNFSMAHMNLYIHRCCRGQRWMALRNTIHVRISTETFNVKGFSYCVSVTEHSADTFCSAQASPQGNCCHGGYAGRADLYGYEANVLYQASMVYVSTVQQHPTKRLAVKTI